MPYSAAVLVWRILNLGLVVFAVWLIYKTLALPLGATTALVIGSIVFSDDPLIYNLAIGQINLVILLLITGAAYAWVRQRQVLAGVLSALAALHQIVPAILFIYFLWKGGLKLVAAGIAAIAAFAAIAFVALGEQPTRQAVAYHHSIRTSRQRLDCESILARLLAVSPLATNSSTRSTLPQRSNVCCTTPVSSAPLR